LEAVKPVVYGRGIEGKLAAAAREAAPFDRRPRLTVEHSEKSLFGSSTEKALEEEKIGFRAEPFMLRFSDSPWHGYTPDIVLDGKYRIGGRMVIIEPHGSIYFYWDALEYFTTLKRIWGDSFFIVFVTDDKQSLLERCRFGKTQNVSIDPKSFSDEIHGISSARITHDGKLRSKDAIVNEIAGKLRGLKERFDRADRPGNCTAMALRQESPLVRAPCTGLLRERTTESDAAVPALMPESMPAQPL
jgi:hypothetical protein